MTRRNKLIALNLLLWIGPITAGLFLLAVTLRSKNHARHNQTPATQDPSLEGPQAHGKPNRAY